MEITGQNQINLKIAQTFAPFLKNNAIRSIPVQNTEKQNKNFLKTIPFLAGSGTLLLGLGIALVVHKKPGSFINIFNNIQKKLSSLIINFKKNPNSILAKITKPILEFFWKGLVLLTNLGTGKDGLAQGVLTHKLNPLSSFGKKIVDGINYAFQEITKFSAILRYNKTSKALEKLEKAVSGLTNISSILKNEIKTRIKQLNTHNEKFKKDFETRAAELCNELKTKLAKFWLEMKQKIFDSSNILHTTTGDPMAIKYTQELVKKNKQKLSEEKKILIKLANELKKLLQGHNKKSVYSEIIGHVNNYKKSLDNAIEFEVDNFAGRMRDVFLGAGVADLFAPAIASIILATKMYRAKNKEERKEKFIKEGIPIIGGLGTWLYTAIVMCLNGPEAVGISLAAGVILSQICKILDNKLNNKTKTPNKPEINTAKIYTS